MPNPETAPETEEVPRPSITELRLLTQNTKLKMNALLSEANALLARASLLQNDHNRLNDMLTRQYQELKEAMDVPEEMDVNLETGKRYDPKALARSQ